MSISAMKQALEAWQTSVYGSESHHKAMLLAMTNMAQAIEQAETAQGQEPFCYHDGRNIVGKEFADHSDVFPLYTTPPAAQQREWVGLTDEEIMEMLDYGQYGRVPQYARNFVDAIEAKLREKNGGGV